MKYIMLETDEGKKIPFVFPNELVHADVADLMCRLVSVRTNQYARPISAGFVELGFDTTVHGESETLSLKSNDSDAAYLALGDSVNMMPDYVVGQLLEKAKSKRKK